MSVTSYNNTACKYRLDKLDKVVYLFNEDALRNIKIDNGNAYVSGITQTPLSMNCYAINLKDEDELDERYKFTHTLTFSMNGYVNYKDFQGRYYVVVKSLENEYWLVNPLFPCKVTYTYTLGANESHTDFTLSTASNHPTLRVIGMSQGKNYECGYRLCGFKGLKLNEKKYSVKNEYEVQYTNAGFDDIHFDKNSQKFTEQFDGTNVNHQIDFNIKFDDYKSSWHYNLLEFTENLYSAIIYTTCGKTILTGFHFGLQPSFTVSAESDQSPNNIQITLADAHNDGNFIGYYDNDDVTITKASGATYEYTTENGAYECVSANTAMYILKKEVDRFGNPTGNYICLEGYEDRFTDLNIVDTFDETDYFVNADCSGEGCNIQTSFPSAVTFNTVSCRLYSILGDSDWSISSSSNHITVAPPNGLANESYTVQVCNTLAPSSAAVTSDLVISYCDGLSKTIGVSVVEGDSCFQAGLVFDISANGQYVTIPTQCCVDSVSESSNTITAINIQDNYIKVYVPTNNSGSARTFTLDVTLCDNHTAVVTINQSNGFERWVFEAEQCDGVKLCELQRKYTGLTVTNINTWTSETRLANCQDSLYCQSQYERWIDADETTCSGGKKYTVQIQQTSTDGNVWVNTDNKRLGVETDDSPAECSGATVYEEWRVVDDDYWCDDTTKYKKYRLYTSTDNENWIATDIYKQGTEPSDIIETDSTDCGFVIPTSSWTCTMWSADTEGYICEETTKYAREQMYGRMTSGECSAATEEWVALGIYRRSDVVLEENSYDCGFVIGSDEWDCDKWEDDGYICDDTTKYVRQQRYVRMCSGDCSACTEDWIATGVYRRTNTVIETNSTDCGFDPITSGWCSQYLWDGDYLCDGYTKYEKLQKFVRDCEVCSSCSATWQETEIFKYGEVLEENSEDCGYIYSISGNCEYWYFDGGTICEGVDEYEYLRKMVRNCPNDDCDDCDEEWHTTNVFKRGELVAANSFNCGYVPPENYYMWRYLGTICDGYDKYERLQKYISDDGNRWYETQIFKKGNLIEGNSEDCGYAPPQPDYEYRWVLTDQTQCGGSGGTPPMYEYQASGYTCSGTSKVDIDVKMVSYDSGTTWSVAKPFTSGYGEVTLNSEDCGYEPPTFNGKFYATYSNGTSYSAECDSNTTITSATTRPSGYSTTAMKSAVIGDCATSIAQNAFNKYSGLTSVTIGDGVTSIGVGVFNRCTKLTSVTIGSSVEEIGYGAFYQCWDLANITALNSITTIGGYAFYECYDLTSITIGSRITSIGDYAFMSAGLTEITILATTPPTIGGYTFNGSYPIYVPAASVSAYQSAWSGLSSRIQAIPNS